MFDPRGVHDTGIPLGPMEIPWEWKHRLNSWELGTGMVDTKWEGNGNSSL